MATSTSHTAPTLSKCGADVEEFRKCMYCGTQSGHVALLLPCLHNICDDCLKQLVHKYQEQGTPRKGKSPHSLICFLCQTAFVVPPLSGPGCLVNNLILTREWLVQRLAVGQKDHDVNGKPRCDECDTDVDDDIISIVCFDCGSFLCADHANIHRKSRSTARHTVSKVEDGCATGFAVFQSSRAQLQPTPCPNHRKEICTFYCKTCREGFCARCEASSLHSDTREHEVCILSEDTVASLELYLTRNLTPLLEKRNSEVDEQLDALTISEQAINTHAEKLSEEITEFMASKRAAVIAELDLQEKQLLDEVDKACWADLRRIAVAKAPLEQENGKLRQALMLGGKLACVAGQAERSSLCLSWSDSASHILTTAAPAYHNPLQIFKPTSNVEWAKSFDILANPLARIGLVKTVPFITALSTKPEASVSKDCAPPKQLRAVASSTRQLQYCVGKRYEGLDGYISVKVGFELSDVEQLRQGGVKVIKRSVRSTIRGGKHVTYCKCATLDIDMVVASSWSQGECCLDFDVPLVGGTYDLTANEVSLAHRLVLPRCSFTFDKCTLDKAYKYGDGRGIRAVDGNHSGAAVGPRILAESLSSQWSILYIEGDARHGPCVGVVRCSSFEADASLEWRKEHTSVLFYAQGQMFWRPHNSQVVEKSEFFNNGSPVPDWVDGGVLRLTVKESEAKLEKGHSTKRITVQLLYENLGSRNTVLGETVIQANPQEIRPFFWFGRGSAFQLLPPY